MTPEEHKQLQQREATARQRAEALADMAGHAGVEVTVPRDGGISFVDGGAFVDAVIWVPAEKGK